VRSYLFPTYIKLGQCFGQVSPFNKIVLISVALNCLPCISSCKTQCLQLKRIG